MSIEKIHVVYLHRLNGSYIRQTHREGFSSPEKYTDAYGIDYCKCRVENGRGLVTHHYLEEVSK